MENNVIRFPWLDEIERDLVDLEITDLDSLKKVREIRKRTWEVVGFEYLNGLLERLVRWKPVLPKGFDSVKDALPHQYSFHFGLLDFRDLDFFRRLANLTLRKMENAPVKIRSDLFRLRSEAVMRIVEIENETGETVSKRKVGQPESAEIIFPNFRDKEKGGR